MASSSGMVFDNADPVGFGRIIFHHIPNGLAEGFEACLIIYAFCLGVMTLEIISNLDYDIALARRSGWISWSKAPNRIAYFVSRYFSFVFLINVLIFSTVAGLNCAVFGKINQLMWLTPIVCVDFIFIQRTMALYGWDRWVCIILYAYFAADVTLAIAAIGFFGKGYVIPESNFCAFYTRNNDDRVHDVLFVLYNIVLNSMDFLIVLLTCHRLVDGGLLGIPRSIKEWIFKMFDNKQHRGSIQPLEKQETISALLIRQGLHYYFILLIVRAAYLVVYYLSKSGQSAYQVLCTAILATLGPILANRLFRETSDFVRQRTVNRSNHNHSDDKVIPHQRYVGGAGLPTSMSANSSTLKMQQLRNNNRSNSYGDDDDDDLSYSGGQKPRPNAQGLKIYVNERMSSFVDDYDDRAPPGLPQLPQRRLTYAEPPPQASSYGSPGSQRPFYNTIPVPPDNIHSPPPPPSQPLPQPYEPSFDIRVKRPNSESSHKPWI